MRLSNARRFLRLKSNGCGGNVMSYNYHEACAAVRTVDAIAKDLESQCSNHRGDGHGPESTVCVGLQAFSAEVVYNWRVLWWSLSPAHRRELPLKMMRESLEKHRKSGIGDERWLTTYTFGGKQVLPQRIQTLGRDWVIDVDGGPASRFTRKDFNGDHCGARSNDLHPEHLQGKLVLGCTGVVVGRNSRSQLAK